MSTQGYPRNFSAKEFRCKCGGSLCDLSFPDASATRHLAWVLQQIRDLVNTPININSGHRCREHNDSVGGASKSKHLQGIAADLDPKGIPPLELYEAIEDLVKSKRIPEGGLGLYTTFVHYDIRPVKARWGK